MINTCWQVRKSAIHTNIPAITWAARVCKKIGVPSLGTSTKSLTSVVVDILSEIFTNEARVPVTTFIRQPADNKAKILTVAHFRDKWCLWQIDSTWSTWGIIATRNLEREGGKRGKREGWVFGGREKESAWESRKRDCTSDARINRYICIYHGKISTQQF